MGKRKGKRRQHLSPKLRARIRPRPVPRPVRRSRGPRLDAATARTFRLAEIFERRRDAYEERKRFPSLYRERPLVTRTFRNRNPSRAREVLERGHAYLVDERMVELYELGWFLGTFLPIGAKPNSAQGFGSPATALPTLALRLKRLIDAIPTPGADGKANFEAQEARDELKGSNQAMAKVMIEQSSRGYVVLTIKVAPEQERVNPDGTKRKKTKQTAKRGKAGSSKTSRKPVRRGRTSRSVIRPIRRRSKRATGKSRKPRAGGRKTHRRASKAKARKPRR